MDFITKRYDKFIDRHGYISNCFNPYNCQEIYLNGIAPTMTTQCGSSTSSSTVLLVDNKNIHHKEKLIKKRKVELQYE